MSARSIDRRSFTTMLEQKKVAEQVIQATTAAKLWPDPIVTEAVAP